jgi:hypothetical protein
MAQRSTVSCRITVSRPSSEGQSAGRRKGTGDGRGRAAYDLAGRCNVPSGCRYLSIARPGALAGLVLLGAASACTSIAPAEYSNGSAEDRLRALAERDGAAEERLPPSSTAGRRVPAARRSGATATPVRIAPSAGRLAGPMLPLPARKLNPDLPWLQPPPGAMSAVPATPVERSALVELPPPAASPEAAVEPSAGSAGAASPRAGPAVEPRGERPPPPPGGFRVHLASYDSRRAAMNGWKLIQGRYVDALGGARPILEDTELGAQGRRVRLHAGPFDRGAASSVCAAIVGQGGWCRQEASGG